jgi:hypothetical protein
MHDRRMFSRFCSTTSKTNTGATDTKDGTRHRGLGRRESRATSLGKTAGDAEHVAAGKVGCCWRGSRRRPELRVREDGDLGGAQPGAQTSARGCSSAGTGEGGHGDEGICEAGRATSEERLRGAAARGGGLPGRGRRTWGRGRRGQRRLVLGDGKEEVAAQAAPSSGKGGSGGRRTGRRHGSLWVLRWCGRGRARMGRRERAAAVVVASRGRRTRQTQEGNELVARVGA